MIVAFFAQLQHALRADPAFASDWQGVMAIEVGAEWWYVRTTANVPQPECVHGIWAGGPDLTVHVATEAAWLGATTAPETIPAIAAAGLITTDDPDAQAFTLARFGAMVELRNAWVLAHPLG